MVGFFLEETVARACSPGGACTAADLLYFRKEPVPWKEVATIAERLPSRQRVREARGRTLRSVHSDLYSLGCVLHELLTGRRPFSGATVFALARQHEELEPTLLRELRPDVDPALERLVLDLLENVPTAAPPTETPPPDKNRPQQAADLLSRQVEKSGCSLGFDHARTLDVRLELADVLCEGGEYQRAASAYQGLVGDLAACHGRDSEPVLRCRLQEATCHAVLGETGVALREMEALLADQRRILGEDDERTLDLRRQIGMLHMGAGDTAQAHRVLSDLLTDIEHLHGPSHSLAEGVHNLLSDLSGDSGW